MTYLGYVIGAYAVFAIVLIWDFIAPRINIARTLREVRMRAQREATRTTPPITTELER
jgi:heme exporter protein D